MSGTDAHKEPPLPRNRSYVGRSQPRSSPCYSPYEVVATTLRTSNIYAYATPPAGWTAFQTISARRWGLIERVSTGALAPLLTLGVGSAHQSTRGTTRHPDNSRQTPA
jgi:hypothetical protein